MVFISPKGKLTFFISMWSSWCISNSCVTHALIYEDTQLNLSIHPDDLTIAACISACLADISSWMKDHHLQLNLAKTELLAVSANPSFHHNFTFQLGSSTINLSKTARNLGVVFDDKLNFTDHITKTARSCRFALYNIQKIRPFLSEHATQLLVQALVLSRLDYCNALLAGLPAGSIKPLQLIHISKLQWLGRHVCQLPHVDMKYICRTERKRNAAICCMTRMIEFIVCWAWETCQTWEYWFKSCNF